MKTVFRDSNNISKSDKIKMVRTSATTVIQNLFNENIIKRMIKWSTRTCIKSKNHSLNTLIAQVRFILDNISGGDLVEMLKSMF